MNEPDETSVVGQDGEHALDPGGVDISPRRSSRARRALLPTVVVVSALLFLGLLVFGLGAQASNSTIDDSLARGRAAPAPAFDLAVLQRGDLGPALGHRLTAAFTRQRISLRELRGVPVVLNIWASWCEPCRQEAPRLERTWRTDGRARGTVFLGLDQQDATSDANVFIRQYGISYPNLHDAGNDVPRDYGTTGVPETYFIDAHGDVVDHVIGVASPRQLRDGILAARTGRPHSVRTGGARRPSR